MQLALAIELPPTRPLIKISSCEDFFDREYDALVADVDNHIFKFAWHIEQAGAERREIRVWRDAALAVWHQRPLPKNPKGKELTAEDVYKLILPNRDLRSTELRRILSCSQELIRDLDPLLAAVGERRCESGPNAYTLYTRASVVNFLEARRIAR